MTDLVPILKGVSLFAELDDRVLRSLAGRCVPRTVGAGFVLFRSGDQCHGLYLILEGSVRVYRSSADGREQTLSVESPGRAVAELPMVDGGTYPASAVTTAPSLLMFLPRPEFEHAFRTDPEVAAAVVRALGRRMRHLVQLVETVAFRDVAARLAMLLADYSDREGVRGPDGVRLELNRTQDELAMEIGTARESVSRSMGQLRRLGLIRSRKGHLLLLENPERLRSWARGVGR